MKIESRVALTEREFQSMNGYLGVAVGLGLMLIAA